jgi:hypothetical protein
MLAKTIAAAWRDHRLLLLKDVGPMIVTLFLSILGERAHPTSQSALNRAITRAAYDPDQRRPHFLI